MLCIPRVRLLTVILAVLTVWPRYVVGPSGSDEPIGVLPFLKITFPVGAGSPFGPLTVTVNVMFPPTADGLGEALMALICGTIRPALITIKTKTCEASGATELWAVK